MTAHRHHRRLRAGADEGSSRRADRGDRRFLCPLSGGQPGQGERSLVPADGRPRAMAEFEAGESAYVTQSVYRPAGPGQRGLPRHPGDGDGAGGLKTPGFTAPAAGPDPTALHPGRVKIDLLPDERGAPGGRPHLRSAPEARAHSGRKRPPGCRERRRRRGSPFPARGGKAIQKALDGALLKWG